MLQFTIIIIILINLLIPSYLSLADSYQWDEGWSYSQEIKIPFDTGSEIAQFQPLDIIVDFKNPISEEINGEWGQKIILEYADGTLQSVKTLVDNPTLAVEHEGKEYSVSFVNSDGQTLALSNRNYWEVYVDGDELQTYVFENSTEDEKKTAEKNADLKDKLIDFCRKIFSINCFIC